MALSRMSLMAAGSARIPFGVKYADPLILPTGNAVGVDFSPTGDAIVVVHSSSPHVTAYSWSSNGFGAKYSNPVVPPVSGGSNVSDVKFTPSGSHVIVSGQAGLFAYPWSVSTGFGTPVQYTIPSLEISAFDISPSGDYILVTGTSTTVPQIRIIPWTGTNFGGPEQAFTTTANNGSSVRFSPDGSYFSVVADSLYSTEGILIFPFNGGVAGSRYLVPGSSNYNARTNFDQSSTYFVSGKGIRSRSGSGFTTSVTNVSPISGPTGLEFSPDNRLLIMGTGIYAKPYVHAYIWSPGAIAYRLGDPEVTPTGILRGNRCVAFSPSGDSIAIAHLNSPYITVYKTSTF